MTNNIEIDDTSLLAGCAHEVPSRIETATLADRIQVIRAHREEFAGHAHGMLRAGVAIGEQLIPIREELRPKRQWLRFVRDHLPFRATAARTYIRLAEHKTQIEAAKADDIALTSIRAALRLITKPKASGTASPSWQARPALLPPIAPSSVMVGDNIDPKASAVALQPAEVTNNYAANRVASGERHPGLTGALRKAVLAVESNDSAAAIVCSFKEFVALARTLGVHLDCIDVCARRVLQ
jgi:hypothetical protein